MFTTAYLDNNTVTLVTDDPIKECAAIFGLAHGRLFPSVIYHEQLENGKFVLLMNYYPRVKGSLKEAMDKEDYKIYSQLRKMCKDCPVQGSQWGRFDYYYNAFKGFPEWVCEELTEALDSCRNYSDNIMIEVSPRNIAVSDGKLILLDIFFCKYKADEKRKRKQFTRAMPVNLNQ